ncbi:hypothetical protein H920_13428 [Fukomys damarensis]|uniref:Uncharacterized protein n=1 Tax=Fukomys damarensis TaxID=885580 RepID=A0A091D2M1_FUKDA|nr:hypothetical protein H920_13428 [Fukomys damarensis]
MSNNEVRQSLSFCRGATESKESQVCPVAEAGMRPAEWPEHPELNHHTLSAFPNTTRKHRQSTAETRPPKRPVGPRVYRGADRGRVNRSEATISKLRAIKALRQTEEHLQKAYMGTGTAEQEDWNSGWSGRVVDTGDSG